MWAIMAERNIDPTPTWTAADGVQKEELALVCLCLSLASSHTGLLRREAAHMQGLTMISTSRAIQSGLSASRISPVTQQRNQGGFVDPELAGGAERRVYLALDLRLCICILRAVIEWRRPISSSD